MGRPREHGHATGDALLAAAEGIVEREGVASLSVRGVAAAVGTTTRAVYSVFGSKEGLLAALGVRAFELLRDGLDQLPTTDDPVADLVAAGLMFREFALAHPSLFAIGVQRNASLEAWTNVRAAAETALKELYARLARLATAGALGGRAVPDAAWQFHALCEGLAAMELRAGDVGTGEAMWRGALSALVIGFAEPVPQD